MRLRRLAAVIGLLLLAPIGAEYLMGYDTSTGVWQELLGNLVIFAPLYGGAALIIREVAVRTGVGWPGRLCWAAAFGIVQAGLVDQSMFNRSYRDISYWEQLVAPTWIPFLGFSVYIAFSFVVCGHMVWSISAPTVVVESIHPELRGRPWLSPVGLGVTILLYLAASYLVLGWHLQTEGVVTGAAQLVGASVVVLVLVGLGVVLGRRRRPPLDAPTPSPWLLGAGTAAAALLLDISPSWPGTASAIALVVVALALIARFSRTPGWSDRHALMIAGGLLLSHAVTGFAVDPIGDGPAAAKYAHNAVAVLLVVTLVAIGWVRLGTRPRVRRTLSADSSTMNAVSEESTDGTAEHGSGGPAVRGPGDRPGHVDAGSRPGHGPD